jgi:hypothetical protein
VHGESAEALLDRHAGGASGSPAVQRKPGEAPATGSAPEPPQGSNVARLIQLLAAPAPAPGGHDDVYTLLSGLSMPDLLATMDGVADAGRLSQLHARVISWTNPFSAARLLSALYAVELVRQSPSSVVPGQLNAAGMALDVLPHHQQIQVVEYVLHRRGTGVGVTELYEGALAMRESKEAAHATEDKAGTTAAGTTGAPPAPIEPGPWNPPGKQWPGFYIGNEAHKAIAREYRLAHTGDSVMSNYYSIESILGELKGLKHNPNAGVLSETELGLEPDIVNLTRLHLYEIKPVDAQARGAAKATLAVGSFGRAGIAMQLGPTTEPGTQGGLPAPDGVYMFWSPEPGVIVYQYRKGRLVPVPVPKTEPATERRWKFELQPLTPQQKQAVATITVGGILLLLAIIALAPVGA